VREGAGPAQFANHTYLHTHAHPLTAASLTARYCSEWAISQMGAVPGYLGTTAPSKMSQSMLQVLRIQHTDTVPVQYQQFWGRGHRPDSKKHTHTDSLTETRCHRPHQVLNCLTRCLLIGCRWGSSMPPTHQLSGFDPTIFWHLFFGWEDGA
jgi:hypothetical protein